MPKRNAFKIKAWFACQLVALVLLTSTSLSCSNYQVLQNGFIVEGDDNFVSIDEKLTVSVGSSFLTKTLWQQHSPPLQAAALTANQKRILKKLGYSTKNYAVIFTSPKESSFQLIGLINLASLSPDKKIDLMSLNELNRVESTYAGWYEQNISLKNQQVYNAIIAVRERLYREKYLSFVSFGEPNAQEFETIKNLAKENAEKLTILGQQYLPSKTIAECNEKTEEKYYDYTIQDDFVAQKQYALVKVYSDEQKTQLVYYSLLYPGQPLGAFRLCLGTYFIAFTRLNGELLWDEVATID